MRQDTLTLVAGSSTPPTHSAMCRVLLSLSTIPGGLCPKTQVPQATKAGTHVLRIWFHPRLNFQNDSPSRTKYTSIPTTRSLSEV
ncbi:hypothetical protein BDV93DRAFT_566169 [Ceratobasidium sp. AG-I]|nr:hypothetical protein BDV93DRAFT_566169 [Ceratobasidium sp. AG-I]